MLRSSAAALASGGCGGGGGASNGGVRVHAARDQQGIVRVLLVAKALVNATSDSSSDSGATTANASVAVRVHVPSPVPAHSHSHSHSHSHVRTCRARLSRLLSGEPAARAAAATARSMTYAGMTFEGSSSGAPLGMRRDEVVQCVARAQASPGGAPGLELELQSVLLPPLSAALLRVELLP